MAYHTVEDGSWPKGTMVSVWPESAVAGGQPTGLAVDIQVASDDGVVSFGGLVEGATYVAFGHGGSQTFEAVNQEARIRALEDAGGGGGGGPPGPVAAVDVSYGGSVNLTAANVEAALDELDTEKAPIAHTHPVTDLGSGAPAPGKYLDGDNSWKTLPGISIIREVVNITDPEFGGIGTGGNGGLDPIVALRAAAAKAKTVMGGTTSTGIVFVPRGLYEVRTTVTDPVGGSAIWNVEGLQVQGEGPEGSRIDFINDAGSGKRAISFQASETATKAKHGLRNMWIRGPSLSNTIGQFPALMDGVRHGNAALGRDCLITGFRSGLNIFKDHEVYENFRVGGNGYGVLCDRTQTGGDQRFVGIECSGSLIAAVAIHPNSNIGGVVWDKCYLSHSPVGVLKLNVADSPGLYDVKFTGNTTSGSNLITNVTITEGAMPVFGAGTPRIVGSGIPDGTHISGYNTGTGVITLSNAVPGGSPNATANATGVTFVAGTFQTEMISASTFFECSFEAYTHGVLVSLASGLNDQRMLFLHCHASSGMFGTAVSGIPVEASFQNVALERIEFIKSDELLKAGTVAAFMVPGSAQRMELGDITDSLDACNTAGKRFMKFKSGVSGVVTGNFKYNTAVGHITQAAGTLAKGDVMMANGLAADGTKAPHGVVQQSASTTDKLVPAITKGPTTLNVDAANVAGITTSGQYLKVDAAHPGKVLAASGPTDGQVVGYSTGAASGTTVGARVLIPG